MTATTTDLSAAIHGLATVVGDFPRTPAATGTWRWAVRQQMAGVRDALVIETGSATEGWLAAREGSLLRERNTLLRRLSALGPNVLESTDVTAVRTDLKRLLVDIAHHVQRVNDLAYDDVELELGGSE